LDFVDFEKIRERLINSSDSGYEKLLLFIFSPKIAMTLELIVLLMIFAVYSLSLQECDEDGYR